MPPSEPYLLTLPTATPRHARGTLARWQSLCGYTTAQFSERQQFVNVSADNLRQYAWQTNRTTKNFFNIDLLNFSKEGLKGFKANA